MAATGKVIGTVTAVVGEAKATAADGTVRILQVGDQVRSDEAISTSAAGSINVALESGKTLDCGGDVSLTLHESILGVATAASASIGAPASDVDAIQRAIAAGQDPSQVAAATAAGGAPAAGGATDGGSHEPVVLEQSNSATVVSSGFTTEGDTISFPAAIVVAEGQASVVSAPADLDIEIEAPAFSTAPAFEAVATPQGETIVASTPAVTVVEPSQTESVVSAAAAPAIVEATEDAPAVADAPVIPANAADEQVAAQSEQPQIVVTEPAQETLAQTPDAEEDAGESQQPPVVVTQPEEEEIVAQNPDTEEDNGESEPVIVAQPEDEGDSEQPPVLVDQPEEESDPVVPVEEPSAELPDSTPADTASLTYSISANTNQDEQIAMLSIENGENAFQTLVLFGQEGQQKPAAVPLGFGITEDTSIVKLQYIDAFAGNSDSNTGQTAQKIAIKDFALGIDGVDAVLAQENDGVNIGVGRSIELEASVELDMTTGAAGEWSFGEPGASSNIDILDVTANTLDLGDLSGLQIESVEVISLKGSEAQELTLAAEDVLNATGSDTLHIMGGKEDTLKLVDDGQWTIVDGDQSAAGNQASYFGWVQVQHTSGATLLVDPDVNINLMG